MKLGLIGCGNMGSALLSGLLKQSLLDPNHIFVYDISVEKTQDLKKTWGVVPLESELSVVEQADTVILAVKPQYIQNVLDKIQNTATKNNPVIISIAAGVTISTLRETLGQKLRLVRVMPNTPALVGEGASGLYFSGNFENQTKDDILKIFEALGTAVQVNSEGMLDVVTGLSGSGPAYVISFINALADGAVKEGLDRATARLLATQTVLGAAKLVKQGLKNSEHPIELRDRVTSPAGTTAAGLFELEKGAFSATVQQAVISATSRSRELGKH